MQVYIERRVLLSMLIFAIKVNFCCQAYFDIKLYLFAFKVNFYGIHKLKSLEMFGDIKCKYI